MDTFGAAAPLSKPTVANATILASKRAGRGTEVMSFKEGSGGFFHNVVVAVDPTSLTDIDTCADIAVFDNSDPDSKQTAAGFNSADLVGDELVFNNWVYDCGSVAASQGSFADIDASAGQVNTVAVEAYLGTLFESDAAEASGLTPLDWTAINGSFPESVADATYLDVTDYAGAVNPDGSDPWWAGWIVPGTLAVPAQP